MTGTVNTVFPTKGFGFISGENGQEYFFHRTDTSDWDVITTRFSNDKIRVIFKPLETSKGPRAANVEVME